MGKIKSLVKSSAVATGLVFCINKIIESNFSPTMSEKTSGKYYHWKQGNIFYKVKGQGTPLLIIHDLNPFSSSHEWTEMMNSLAINHRVYVPDLIGCGKSDKPSFVYTNYFYVQMIRDFVKDVIGEKTDVIANGLSASFVIMANTTDPDLFDSIAMINPTDLNELKKAPDEHAKLLIKLFQLPVFGKALYYLASSKSNIDYYLTEKCFYSPFHATPEIIRSYYKASHASTGNGKMLFASLLGKYLNTDISKALEKTENRILLITGEELEDREKIEASYLKLCKNIKAYSIPKSRRLPHLEEAKGTSQLVLQFC